METRRGFIKKSAVIGGALCLPVSLTRESRAAYPDLKTRNPKRMLVLWYSQTGQTRRHARHIGCILKGKGLAVDAFDMQEFDKNQLSNYDLIIVGTPVFYYDTPANVGEWLETIPSIKGTPVAAFVSFGGPEGNQHNASSHILKLLADKGGVPVGRDTFRNIASYPTPNWSNPKQISGQHLPNAATFDQVRRFTADVMERITLGETISVGYEVSLREGLSWLPLVWLNKKAISKHTVDAQKCIGCQTCVRKCPTKAINPSQQTVDRDKCLACFGCLNNCPADAVVMEYRGERLYGFPEYLKRNKITIMEPAELNTCSL
ncbi:MAG: EFR1 family ferrodoxin [Deltaproteobacteria bacterium]|nr:EFR1 family ferrodoxin [Deltaproteobacteria bacterium]